MKNTESMVKEPAVSILRLGIPLGLVVMSAMMFTWGSDMVCGIGLLLGLISFLVLAFVTLEAFNILPVRGCGSVFDEDMFHVFIRWWFIASFVVSGAIPIHRFHDSMGVFFASSMAGFASLIVLFAIGMLFSAVRERWTRRKGRR